MHRLTIYTREEWRELAFKCGYNATLLTKQLNVSPRHLNRRVHELFGRSLGDWLEDERLRAAPEILKKTRRVKEVASMLGYKHVSHFSQKFHDHYGVCPTEFLAQ